MTLALGLVGIGCDLVLAPSLSTVLIFTDNLYAAALYGSRWLSRWLWWASVPTAVVFGAVTLVMNQEWSSLVTVTLQAALVVNVPVVTAVIVRQHREQVVLERERAEQVVRLAELDRNTAIAAERSRMARELHDVIANHFSAIAIQSTAVLTRKDLDGAVVRRVLESIRENSVEGMAEMRTMIGLLRQENEEVEVTRHRLADVSDLVERSKQAGVTTGLRVAGTPRGLPPATDLAGYRIVQESLTNVLKHGTGRGEVLVEYLADLVTVTIDSPVSSEGSLFPGSGAGLVGMNERAALLGGVLEAGPYAGGWRVRAELPAPPGKA
ncbi:sensor histidine kinase [Sinosporangium album]|uniref:sensor histidine kinase n=1 Tax=Sinosporangium album TaxID=504805 RepID=UPI001FE1989B|nr:histidine kinase [Sinosporangium album]